MEITTILEEIGLTKSEVKIYLSLLEIGTSSAGEIVKKSKTTSSKIYETLEKLSIKGLVSSIIQEGVKMYAATNPSQILDFLNEKENRIKKQKKVIELILPELEKKLKNTPHDSEARVYKGLKGLKSAFYEKLGTLNKGDTFLSMGVPSRSEEVNTFFLKYGKELEKRGIKIKSLFGIEAKGEPQTKEKKLKNLKVKYFDDNTAAATNVLGDRVIIFPKEVKEPILFVIDNKDVAQSFRIQFKKLWNKV